MNTSADLAKLKRTGRSAALITVLLCLLLSSPGTVAAEGGVTASVNDCQTIDSAGTYAQTSAITSSGSGICIHITASDVVFDGGGNTIDGMLAGTTGVYVADGLVNVTVKDVRVDRFADGIYFGGDDGRLQNVTVEAESGGYAASVAGSDNVVENNVFKRSGATGVALRVEGASNALENNRAINGEYGYRINGSHNTLTGSVVTGSDVFLTVGIEVGPNASNVTLQDVAVDTWTRGINFRGDDGRIDNATVDNVFDTSDPGARMGVVVFGSNNTITNTASIGERPFQIEGVNNTMTDSESQLGVILVMGDHNTLERNVGNTTGSGSGYGVSGDYNTLTNNTIVGSPYYGVHITQGSDNTIANNVLNGTDHSGIYLFESENNTLIGNDVTDAYWYGIQLKRSHNTTIRDILADDARVDGMYSSDSTDLLIVNSSVNNAGEDGISLGGAARSMVDNLTAKNIGDKGMRISGASGIVVRNSTVSDTEFHGIHVTTSGETLLEGNVVEGAGTWRDEYGIFVESGSGEAIPNVTIRNNTVIDSYDNGIMLDWGIDAVVTDNGVRNPAGSTSIAGITIKQGSSNVTVANNTLNETQMGIELFDTDNSTVRDNHAFGIGSTALWLDTVTDSTVTRNRLSGGSYTGIRLSGSENLIYDNYINNTNHVEFTSNNPNAWNVSKRAGENVAGGSFLGGNYYATPAGDGFSETCADGDGLCDSSLEHSPNNTDYLPLATSTVASPSFTYSDLAVFPTTLTVGETVTVNATVSNDGDGSGDYSARLFVNGSSETSASGTLAPGENETISFSPTFTAAGSYGVTVENLPAQTVVVETDSSASPAYFDVGIDSINSPVEEGEWLEVNATVENTGDESDTKTVTLDLDGTQVDSQSVTLDGGASKTITLRHLTDNGDVGQHTANVASADAQVSETVDVTATSGDPDIVVSPTTLDFEYVPVHDTKQLNVTVANTGTAALSVDTLNVRGRDYLQFEIIDEDPFSLAPGETRNVTIKFRPSESGEKLGLFDLYSNDLDESGVTVSLSGTTEPDDITVSGQLALADGSPAINDTVALLDQSAGDSLVTSGRTDANGNFSLRAPVGTNYTVAYVQWDDSGNLGPVDGSPDVIALETITGNSTVVRTLPDAYEVNVTVVRGDTGEVVSGALVTLAHKNESARATLAGTTDDRGRFVVNNGDRERPGIEAVSTLRLDITPLESDLGGNVTTVNVTETTNATVVLEADGDDDGSGDGNGPGSGSNVGGGDDDLDGDSASFVVSNVSTNASRATVGETVTVTATIRNDGDADGTFTAELTADETTVATRSVDVAADEETGLSLEWRPAATGDYALALNEQSAGTVSVVDSSDDPGDDADDDDSVDAGRGDSDAATETEAPAAGDDADGAGDPDDGTPGFGALAALVAIALAAFVGRRR